ncbi:MAG TPA: hypothetical protein VGH28_13610 [Polyangiaceae bacterium]
MVKRWVAFALTVAGVAAGWGCTIDPGPNFVVPLSVFNQDFFYCHVEPEYLFAPQTQCGAGAAGDNGNCHFNSSAVSGMALQQHAPIDCGGGDHPVSNANVGPGSAAANNFSAASLEMVRDCVDYASCQAPILKRPTSTAAHPRMIFDPTDPTLPNVIYKWAATP